MMLVQRQSLLNMKRRTIMLPVTEKQLQKYYNGMDPKLAMPELTDDQIEFVKSGILPSDWDALIK